MTTSAPSTASAAPATRFALFDYGFRPFFLLCGLFAALMVPLWLFRFAHASVPFGALPGVYWHAHEMLFGFIGAAIAGFLLTAVPSWTGSPGFAGRPLIALTSLWLAGRIAMATIDAVPFWLAATLELALLPALLALLAPPILRARNRNLPILGVITLLWLIDAAFMRALATGDLLLAAGAARVAIDLVLMLVVVIGGRIVPAFTGNALRKRGAAVAPVSRGWVEFVAIGSVAAIVVCDLLLPDSRVAGALAAIAGVAHAVRLAGWRSFRVRGEPILWVLHVAYAWIPVALALKAAWLLGDAAFAAKWQHALTFGAFGTMILAVMTRASLGHTGRPLVVSRAIACAYVLMTLGAALRVFGGAWTPQYYLWTLTASGLCWSVAFLIFVWVYGPLLMSPRLDGRHG
ncbi:MAG TPA: NnrS family protein [Steroidobacteraceae bacterium]